ncbi:MAG TPA: Ig domain-containing protein, partial [Terriglobus sp.]
MATFLCILGAISGCGTNDIVRATATGASATINAGQTIQIPVAAPANANWTLAGTGCSDKTCGTVAPAADAVLYIAPPAVGSQIRVTATASDASTTAGTKFDVTVNPALALDATLSDGVVDTPYTATVTATGGTNPIQLSLADGFLPEGLLFNASNGIISGTPKTDGDYPLTFKATDASNVPAATQLHRTLHISRQGSGSGASLHITTASLSTGIVGSAYQAQLAATGGNAPYTWTRTSGTLPAGITLTSTGVIQGTPTTAGLTSFAVQVVDSNGTSDTASLKLNINSAQTSLVIGNTTLSPAQINTAYSAQFNISGGTAPYTCAIAGGTVPRGLQLNGCGITGTPTTAGNTTFELAVADAT